MQANIFVLRSEQLYSLLKTNIFVDEYTRLPYWSFCDFSAVRFAVLRTPQICLRNKHANGIFRSVVNVLQARNWDFLRAGDQVRQ